MTRLLLVLLVLGLVGCREAPASVSPSPAAIVDTDAKKPARPAGFALNLSAFRWETLSRPANNWPLSNDASGALTFAVPPLPDSMNYLYTQSPSRSLAGTVRVDLQAVGAGLILPWEPCSPTEIGAARVFVISHRMDWSGEFSRWWGIPDRVDLVEGAFSLAVPVTPERWSSVYGTVGTQAPDHFASAMRDVSALGLTFGSCFFGHGIYLASGSARVVLSRYEVR